MLFNRQVRTQMQRYSWGIFTSLDRVSPGISNFRNQKYPDLKYPTPHFSFFVSRKPATCQASIISAHLDEHMKMNQCRSLTDNAFVTDKTYAMMVEIQRYIWCKLPFLDGIRRYN